MLTVTETFNNIAGK